jgi:hypothetical protein
MPGRQYFISATLVVVSLILWIFAMISARWQSFSSTPIFLTAIAIWIIWVIRLGRISIQEARKHQTLIGGFILFFGVLFAGFIAFIVAWLVGLEAGRILCAHEVRKAVDAGLREDCLKLLQNWPTKDDRIGCLNPYFTNLAPSIRMLSPVYVINENIDYTNIPPNIGVYKNGFGGFVCGVRVFRNDEDASNYVNPSSLYDHERVAPGIYVLWGPM